MKMFSNYYDGYSSKLENNTHAIIENSEKRNECTDLLTKICCSLDLRDMRRDMRRLPVQTLCRRAVPET